MRYNLRMNPRPLAYMLLWSMGLFVLGYGLQGPIAYFAGTDDTALALFILLGISAIFSAWSIRVLYDAGSKGLAAFGIVAVALLIILLLSRYQFLGLLFALVYDVGAIGKLFKMHRQNQSA